MVLVWAKHDPSITGEKYVESSHLVSISDRDHSCLLVPGRGILILYPVLYVVRSRNVAIRHSHWNLTLSMCSGCHGLLQALSASDKYEGPVKDTSISARTSRRRIGKGGKR